MKPIISIETRKLGFHPSPRQYTIAGMHQSFSMRPNASFK
jgi:hypothetical protein